MFETLDRLVLAGLGALSMTRERAEEIFEEYVERGQAVRTDRAGFVEDLMTSARRSRQDLESLIVKQVQQAIVQLNIATREDLVRLESKLDELLARGR